LSSETATLELFLHKNTNRTRSLLCRLWANSIYIECCKIDEKRIRIHVVQR